jgi:hypothetical protein
MLQKSFRFFEKPYITLKKTSIPLTITLIEKNLKAHHFLNAHKSRMGIPTGIFHMAKSSGLLSHNHLHTHLHQIFQIRNPPRWDRTEQCPDKTLDTVQKPSLFLLALNSAPKCHIWKNSMNEPTVPAESHFACHVLINAGQAKLWKSLEDNGLSKMEPSNATCCAHLSTSFPPVRWNPHQL